MIQTEKWKKSTDNPGKRIYDGQRTAREIFDDLEAHLTSIGYLPDEYFLFDESRWGNGREFPSDGWLTNGVDFGGNEGVYLDITLEYYENREHRHEHFATGKTLGESGDELDRIYLIAAAVTKAFHADGVHARYMVVGESPAPEGITINLNSEERRLVADSLAQRHERLASEAPEKLLTNQLLPRIGIDIAEQEHRANPVPAREPNIINFYCPLTVKMEDDEGGEFVEMDVGILGYYEDTIRDFIEADMKRGGVGLPDCFQVSPELQDKLLSVRFDVENVRNEIFGCIRVNTIEPLTDEEKEEIRDYCIGQASDCYGEGLAQRPLKTDDGDLFISFWDSDEDWFMLDDDEFERHLDGQFMGGLE
jgi:hypothetical protein